MYDLTTGKETRITYGDYTNQSEPAIYDNKIVWMDSRSGNSDIHGYYQLPSDCCLHCITNLWKKPLTVKFTDMSTDAYYWSWDFGDKTTSTEQNPTHKYTKAGKYSVSLTVKNAAGSKTAKKTKYITVN